MNDQQWTANIPPEAMAMKVVSDLCKKFRQLDAMPPEKFAVIAQGLVDGLKATTFPYPGGGGVPNFRRSMDPNYCAGFDVGTSWRRIAKEWPTK